MSEDTSQQSNQSMFNNVPPKFTFLFGLVIGIAAFSLFGYVSLLSRVSGSETTSTTNKATATADAGSVAGDTDTQDQGQAAVDVKPLSDEDYIRGNADAAVTIIEYSDLECPYCKTFHNTVEQVMQKYPNDVKWVSRHYPLSFHANAQKEAEAAECIAAQGGAQAYWDFIDTVFERTTSNGTGFALESLAPLATELGYNASKLQDCLDAGTYSTKIQNDLTEGTAAGVSGTPTSFILDADGNVVQTIPGALSFTQVDQAISGILP